LVYCGQTVGRIKMKLGLRVGLGPGHTALGGDPAAPPTKGHSSQFSAHICCGQMAAWIKMPLGTELGLGPGDFVLDGDTAPLPKRERSPRIFGPCLLWPNGWMDQDGILGMEIGLSPGDFALDGNPAASQCSIKRVQQLKNVKSHVFWILKKTLKTLKTLKTVHFHRPLNHSGL